MPERLAGLPQPQDWCEAAQVHMQPFRACSDMLCTVMSDSLFYSLCFEPPFSMRSSWLAAVG